MFIPEAQSHIITKVEVSLSEISHYHIPAANKQLGNLFKFYRAERTYQKGIQAVSQIEWYHSDSVTKMSNKSLAGYLEKEYQKALKTLKN